MMCGRNCFFIGDVNDFIDQFEIEVSWDKISVNILNFMWVRFNFFICQRLGDNWRIGWFNGDRDKIGFVFGVFNVAVDVSQCIVSFNVSNKYINLIVGIFLYFWIGGFFVNFRVCWIVELLQQQVFFWIVGDNFFCFLDCVFYVFSIFCQYQVCI